MARIKSISLLVLMAAVVLGVAVVPAGAEWIDNGVAMCTENGEQLNVASASDGAGGAFIAWSDRRAASGEVYAQRINSSGAALWAAA